MWPKQVNEGRSSAGPDPFQGSLAASPLNTCHWLSISLRAMALDLGDLALQETAMSRDTSGCHSLGGGRGSTRISRLEIKEANILQHTG